MSKTIRSDRSDRTDRPSRQIRQRQIRQTRREFRELELDFPSSLVIDLGWNEVVATASFTELHQRTAHSFCAQREEHLF